MLILNLKVAVRGNECLFAPRDRLKNFKVTEAFDGGDVVFVKAQCLEIRYLGEVEE